MHIHIHLIVFFVMKKKGTFDYILSKTVNVRYTHVIFFFIIELVTEHNTTLSVTVMHTIILI